MMTNFHFKDALTEAEKGVHRRYLPSLSEEKHYEEYRRLLPERPTLHH